jgi:hypothetical protein
MSRDLRETRLTDLTAGTSARSSGIDVYRSTDSATIGSPFSPQSRAGSAAALAAGSSIELPLGVRESAG